MSNLKFSFSVCPQILVKIWPRIFISQHNYSKINTGSSHVELSGLKLNGGHAKCQLQWMWSQKTNVLKYSTVTKQNKTKTYIVWIPHLSSASTCRTNSSTANTLKTHLNETKLLCLRLLTLLMFDTGPFTHLIQANHLSLAFSLSKSSSLSIQKHLTSLKATFSLILAGGAGED